LDVEGSVREMLKNSHQVGDRVARKAMWRGSRHRKENREQF
jgi:hypothetical protein